MKKDAANLSAGDQTYLIRPIAYTESGKELFTFKLAGVDGGLNNSSPRWRQRVNKLI